MFRFGRFAAGRCYVATLVDRFTFQNEPVAVVHEPIEDGVGDGAIAEIGVPGALFRLEMPHTGCTTVLGLRLVSD